MSFLSFIATGVTLIDYTNIDRQRSCWSVRIFFQVVFATPEEEMSRSGRTVLASLARPWGERGVL